MNRLIEKKQLQEMCCGDNFSYILTDNGLFLPTEYKVLQSQSDGGFVRCMKMQYNGHIQLYYMVNSLKPLSNMFSSLDADAFLVIVANLFADILETRSNGFLSCQKTELSFDKIFVDPNTLKVSLVYLPLNVGLYDDYASYESQLRSNLVKLISSIPHFSVPKLIRFSMDLSNGMLSLDDLCSRIKGGAGSFEIHKTKPESPPVVQGIQKMCLISLNAPTRVEIEVTKDSFVIGKNPAAVDGVVSFNKMISRVHCRIDKKGNNYTVTDLQSANKTYVNRMRLQPNVPHPVKNGDVIRMANSDFQVIISNRGVM